LDQIGENNRFLTATRFEYKTPYKIVLGIGHAALYGGENQKIDLAFSNPMSFSYAEQHNNRNGLNSMVYADIAYFFQNKYRFYGELLIDDYQVEKNVQGDQEPNEIGFTLGCNFIDIKKMDGFVEFTQIRNRTYNVADIQNYEKYIHRNYVIGHRLGNDFQLFNIEVERWLDSKMQLGGGYLFLKLHSFEKKILFDNEQNKPSTIISTAKELVMTNKKKLNGEDRGRINILLLGMGGEGHSGKDLTDTIILASINPNNYETALISIPFSLTCSLNLSRLGTCSG